MSVLWRRPSITTGRKYTRWICGESGIQPRRMQIHHCKLLIVGAGAGGCSIAWRFSKKLGEGEIIVLEPSDKHYYQPLFTLVGGGIKPLTQTHRPLRSVLPPSVTWLRDSAARLDPCNCCVTTLNHLICYQYLVVAVGLVNDYQQVAGLKAALNDPTSGVCTIYSPQYCQKTWRDIQSLQCGHAIFTFPRQGVKCSGAAQKIMYLADSYFRNHKKRDSINITYATGNQHLFGIPKYAATLMKICKERQLSVNYQLELAEVRRKEAVFKSENGNQVSLPFNFLHVTPPMKTPTCLRACSELVNEDGYVDVDKYSLRHNRFSNVFALGDCTSTPNSKTAAAVSCQSKILEDNLTSAMENKEMTARYSGYGACPILTSYKRGILAEFDYNKVPMETFPFDQSKERRMFFYFNKDIFPRLYWNKLIKGTWNGPAGVRRILNPFKR